jgi:hypothetical protein
MNKHLPTDIDKLSRKELVEIYHIHAEEMQKALSRIAELEKQLKDAEECLTIAYMQGASNAHKRRWQRDLEMQAKGIIEGCNSALEKIEIPEMSALRAEYFKAGVTALSYLVDREAEQLRNQAKKVMYER